MARWGTPSTTARRPPLGFPFRAGRWVDAAGTKDGHGNGETVEDRSAEPVIADEKMSEIAGVELVHLMVEASFTKSSWRCPTDFAEGGRSERDLRNERGGSHHTGYRRGTAHCKEHASPVSEITRCHEAQASAAAGIQAGFLRRVRRPADVEGLENCVVLHWELRALGYDGGYFILKSFVSPKRRRRQPDATMRFETAPGEQAQVD